MPAASSSAADGQAPRAAIVGVAGASVSAEERALFARHPPLGFILFGRHCLTPAGVAELINELRAAVGRPDAPVLIDQEGGRVMRLCPPSWPARPAARALGRLAERDLALGREAAWLHARLIAAELHGLGITVNCAPVLDLGQPATTAAIGDRAFSSDPAVVAALGLATIDGYLAGGILPVIKHLPGHGRATVDSHVGLPVVDATLAELAAADWLPFRACALSPLAMTAHVLYPALDEQRPATLSAPVIDRVIRGEIGFAGGLLSDDLSMGALGGRLGERAAAALAAGCDVALHCNGVFAELVEVLEAAPPLAGPAAARLTGALARRPAPLPFDVAAGEARLAALLDRLDGAAGLDA